MHTPAPRLSRICGAIAGLGLFVCLSSHAADGAAAAPSTTIGNEVDDSVLTARVRAALMANEAIKSIDIKVKTRKDQVMLSGFADNQDQIDRAIVLVNGVEGVVSVDNQMSLKEGKQTVGNKIDDSVITARVKSALLSDPLIKSGDVLVTTRKGEVQLSGFIADTAQIERALEVTRGVEGVRGVVNHMSRQR